MLTIIVIVTIIAACQHSIANYFKIFTWSLPLILETTDLPSTCLSYFISSYIRRPKKNGFVSCNAWKHLLVIVDTEWKAVSYSVLGYIIEKFKTLLNFTHWRGKNKLFPTRESLVSDNWRREIVNIFLQCMYVTAVTVRFLLIWSMFRFRLGSWSILNVDFLPLHSVYIIL